MSGQHVVLFLGLLAAVNAKAASVPEEAPPESVPQDSDDKIHQQEINLFGFTIIRNSTMPCHKISENGRNQYRFHPLSNDDKLAILEIKGGRFMKEYMAKDEVSARETFPCLLDLDYNFEDRKLHPIWKPKWKLTKAAIKHQLDKTAMEEERLANEPPVVATSEESHHSKGAVTREKGEVEKKPSKPENDIITQRNDTEVHKKKIKDGTFVRPGDIGLPTQITDEDSGDVSLLEMCLTRGTRTKENTHLYMCTTCSATTNLGDKYWPTILNEAKCLEADPYCFIVDMIPHGVCKQKIIPMKVLQKKAGYCALGLKNGETVIVEEWTTIEKEVHMGCECVIDVNSEFARYVGRFEIP